MFKQAKDISPLPAGMADAFSRELQRQGFESPVQESPTQEEPTAQQDEPEVVSESVEEVVVEAKLDPVDTKSAKKKFDDREDKDLDNDGDVDSSDKYLHMRRKAITKALAMKEEVELDEGKMSELQDYIDQGKTAEWIAKKIGFPVKDVKAFMSKYEAYEEVSLDEAAYTIKDGEVHISKANFRKIHKDLKDTTKGDEMMLIDGGKRGSIMAPVVFEEVEEVDLVEAPEYKLHHSTFSGAVQEAMEVAKKSGFEVDDDDWHSKVAMGPKKPSVGKTNRYSVELMKNGKPTKKSLQIQVYNMGAKYELNCYVQ